MPDGGLNTIIIPITIDGQIIVSLNGLLLAQNYDYTISGSVLTLSGETVSDDIITIISGTFGATDRLQSDNIFINSEIASGPSNNQGSNKAYFNTTSGKYEIYTTVTPKTSTALIVMLNGAILTDGIDFYQSTSNSKRIILEGDLQLDDIITISYYALTNIVNGLTTNTPMVGWAISNAPQTNSGVFSLEVSTGNTFNTFYYSGNTPYVVGQIQYTDTFIASGNVGTKLYYRVKNSKNFVTFCGDIVNSTIYSEIIPLTIQTNSINSY
jgi:hypothetical protein